MTASPITIFNDAENYNVVHPLTSPWTLWFDANDRKGNCTAWSGGLKKIATFTTIEEFWSLFNQCPSVSEINGTYHLFKEGIEPKWEDPKNLNGGRWLIDINKSLIQDEQWMNLVLATVGCDGLSFEEYESINGLVFQIRVRGNRLYCWVGNTEENVCRPIGKWMKKMTGFNKDLDYHSFKDTKKAMYNTSQTE